MLLQVLKGAPKVPGLDNEGDFPKLTYRYMLLLMFALYGAT
jgi:hypothetical protein